MNILLDLMGSTLIGGMVVLAMFNLNILSSSYKFSSDSQLHMQQNAKAFADMLDNDLRKMGYRHSSTSIVTAQLNKLSFYSDIDSNNTQKLVSYSLSDSLAAWQTENPCDKILYRVVNNDTLKGASLGLTDLKFHYMNLNGAITSNPDSIKFIKVEIWIQSTEKIDGQYPFTYWEMTINPRNI
jgi:hypothetical protein